MGEGVREKEGDGLTETGGAWVGFHSTMVPSLRLGYDTPPPRGFVRVSCAW